MAQPSVVTSLAVGDRVVYPNQGVCRVSSVEAKEVAGQKLTFVTMKREEDGAVVMVPQAKIAAIGVRKVASSEDIQAIFAFLKSDSDKANLDWKQRARTNLDRMSQGGILGLAEVVKGLQVLSELRPLPSKERELYDTARHLLVAEMAASLNIPECDCEDAIDLVLFPPGRERPKRTADEFRMEGAEDLELGDDLLGIGDDLDMPEDESSAEEPSSDEEASGEEEEAATPAKKKTAKARLSDDDETQPMGTKLSELEDEEPAPKKRGRPPKAKPAAVAAAPETPKKRGRPPKAKPAVQAPPPVPVKRGRPPKAAATAAEPVKAKGKKK